MIRLPKLTAGSLSWRLPFSEHAAASLARSFLADDADQRRQELAEVLSEDAALVLWTVCRANQRDVNPPGGIDDLARWLSEYGLDVLQWSESEQSLQEGADADQMTRWADLAVDAVATARCAARLAGSDDADRVYLCGLLHSSLRWLASSGSSISLLDCRPGAAGLPQWLVQLLSEIDDRPPKSFCPRIVAQSIDGLREAVEGTDADVQNHRDNTSEVRKRWMTSSARAGGMLPRLMRRLARLAQLEAEFESALETEKVEALKALAYGASHEINNPLNNISTRAQTLMREETDPERLNKLGVINKEAFRAYEMIADMMLFARPPALLLEPVNLTALVDRVIEELTEEAEEQSTAILRVTSDEPLPVTADGSHLAVALKALCTNSLEALSAGGRIEIFVQQMDAPRDGPDDSRWAEILVSDTGPGLSAEVRRHLFDPYFSGREAGRGIGLGLSKCWRIVDEHGGRIEVNSEPGRGTTFAIRLPMEACPSIRTAC